MHVRKSPHKQVRKHARRLNDLFNSRVRNAVSWIDTCVFYSYTGAEVHHLGRSGTTSIVSDDDQLKRFLDGVGRPGQQLIDVDRVVQALHPETGDVTGTPPLGLNLFVASGMSGMSVIGVAKAAIPSALVLLAALALVTFVPFFATAFV